MILRPSYLHNGICYTGKMKSLDWIRAQEELTQLSFYRESGNLVSDNTV